MSQTYGGADLSWILSHQTWGQPIFKTISCIHTFFTQIFRFFFCMSHPKIHVAIRWKHRFVSDWNQYCQHYLSSEPPTLDTGHQVSSSHPPGVTGNEWLRGFHLQHWTWWVGWWCSFTGLKKNFQNDLTMTIIGSNDVSKWYVTRWTEIIDSRGLSSGSRRWSVVTQVNVLYRWYKKRRCNMKQTDSSRRLNIVFCIFWSPLHFSLSLSLPHTILPKNRSVQYTSIKISHECIS